MIAPTFTAKVSPLLKNGIQLPTVAKRNVGRAAAKAALAYMIDHAPVRTGLLKNSWGYGNASGYSVHGNTIHVHLQNNAFEVRRRDPRHYYAQYVEEGFYHVLQRKYHPGRHDLKGASLAARAAGVAVLKKEFTHAIRLAKSGVNVVYESAPQYGGGKAWRGWK